MRGPAQAGVCRGFGVSVQAGAHPATSPTGGLVPHRRSERQLTESTVLAGALRASCSPAKLRKPSPRPDSRHGCWRLRWSPGGGGGRGGSWLALQLRVS